MDTPKKPRVLNMRSGLAPFLDALSQRPDEYSVLTVAGAAGRPVELTLGQLRAARARLAELEAVVESLHYRMTCVDPQPTSDEIVSSLSRVRRSDKRS